MSPASAYKQFSELCDKNCSDGTDLQTPEMLLAALLNPSKLVGFVNLVYGVKNAQAREAEIKYPEAAEEFISDLDGMGDAEKAALIHEYVNGNMSYDGAESKREQREGNYGFNYNDVLQNMDRGDCENYAMAKIALMRKAGIPDEDIMLVMGDVKYEPGNEGPHAVVVVRIDGKFYMYDNNLDEPVLLDEDLKGTGTRTDPKTGEVKSVEVTLRPELVVSVGEPGHSRVYNLEPPATQPTTQPDANPVPDVPKPAVPSH